MSRSLIDKTVPVDFDSPESHATKTAETRHAAPARRTSECAFMLQILPLSPTARCGRSGRPCVCEHRSVRLLERWRERGEAWRFPTRTQATENIRSAVDALKRPAVIVLVIVIWFIALALSWGMSDNTVPLVGAMCLTVVAVRIASTR
jgi:hypothetical protein